jgi:hypothetical protein
MALGMFYGEEVPTKPQAFPTSLGPSRVFCHRFSQDWGCTMCGDIVESVTGKTFNLADPADVHEWRALGVLKSV